MPETGINVKPNNERRYDWQANHEAIRQCILEGLSNPDKKERRFPTYKEISVSTGLSIQHICEHAKALDMQEIRTASRLLAPDILQRQAMRAYASGDHNEAKTYFKLNFDWKESSDVTVSGQVQHSHIIGKPISQLSKEELIAAKNDPTIDIQDGRLVQIAEYTDIPNGDSEPETM